MSLVGSEVKVLKSEKAEDDGEGAVADDDDDDDDHGCPPTPLVSNAREVIDKHEPPTPRTGAENFFLGSLATENISAAALAQEINERHKPLMSTSSGSGSAPSSPSGDFRTARSDISDNCSFPDKDEEEEEVNTREASAITNPRELNFEEEKEPETTRTMSTKAAKAQTTVPAPTKAAVPMTKTTTSTPTVAPVPAVNPPPADMDEEMHVDPAEKVYDTVKGVWSWGKGVILFSPFLGIAEGIAGKVVETAGSSLEDVDSALTGKIQGLDDGILNPAIHVIVKTVLGAASQTKSFVEPIVLLVLKPLDFMIKSKPENESEATPAPEVTPQVPMN